MSGATARALVAAAVAELERLEAPRELLGALVRPKLFGRIERPARVRPLGEVWRLGSLLLSPDGRLYRVGDIIVTEPERHRGYVSELARARAELKAAARRGRIPAGRAVNLDAVELDLDALGGPLRWREDTVEFEWTSGSWMPLERYLSDRIALR